MGSAADALALTARACRLALPSGDVEPAVDHYFGLLSADVLPSDSFCLTAVQGLTVEEALERFDGYPGWAVADLAEVGQRSIAVYPDELPAVIADEVDGWVLLAENNGWHGAKTSALQRLSAGTVVASAFWNVNRHSMISLARDGEVLAAFDFVIGRVRPAALVPHLDGLEFTDPYRQTAEALAFVERVSGVRLTAEWATGRHPASVIGDLWRFHPCAWPKLGRMRSRQALHCKRKTRPSRSNRRCTTPVRPIGRDGLLSWRMYVRACPDVGQPSGTRPAQPV